MHDFDCFEHAARQNIGLGKYAQCNRLDHPWQAMSLNAATLCWQAVSRLTETLKSVTDAREDLETSLAAAQVRASSTYNPFKSQQAQRQLSHFGR